MRNFVRSLPFSVEFAVVVAGAFGLAITTSIMAMVHPPTGPIHTEPGLWRTVAMDVVVFVILGLLLRARGWTFKRLGLESHWMDGIYGVALAAAAYAVFLFAYQLLSATSQPLVVAANHVAHLPKVLSPWIIAAMVLVTSFYEEFFVGGYVITALKEKTNPTLAINVSVAIRLAYHIYQGAMSVVLMIPIGLIFGYWYAKTGRLWPLVVAHAALNLLSFLPYVKF